MKRLAIAAVAVTAALTLAACGGSTSAGDLEASAAAIESAAEAGAGAGSQSAPPDNATRTIAEITSTAPGFETLTAALKASGVDATLNGEGPFTVFAPSNDAFAALPPGVLDALQMTENKDVLVKILTYHVLPVAVKAAEVTDGDVATVEGQKVTLASADGVVTVNGAKVIQADVVGKNGVGHAIDAVLIPPDVDINALVAQ